RDWSSDVCSSDLDAAHFTPHHRRAGDLLLPVALERLHLALARPERPEEVHPAAGTAVHRRRREYRLVGVAGRLRDLTDPDDPAVPGVPSADHELRHQLGLEGLISG